MPGKRLILRKIVQALREGGRIRLNTEIITRKGQDEIAQVAHLYIDDTSPLGVVSDRQIAKLRKHHGLVHRPGGIYEFNSDQRGTDADVQ